MRPPIALCYDAAGALGLESEIAAHVGGWLCKLWRLQLVGVA